MLCEKSFYKIYSCFYSSSGVHKSSAYTCYRWWKNNKTWLNKTNYYNKNNRAEMTNWKGTEWRVKKLSSKHRRKLSTWTYNFARALRQYLSGFQGISAASALQQSQQPLLLLLPITITEKNIFRVENDWNGEDWKKVISRMSREMRNNKWTTMQTSERKIFVNVSRVVLVSKTKIISSPEQQVSCKQTNRTQ